MASKVRSPKTFGKKIRDIENSVERLHTELTKKQTTLAEVASIAQGPSADVALRNIGDKNTDLTELGDQFPGKTEGDLKSHFGVLADAAAGTFVPINFGAAGSANAVNLSWTAPAGADSATRYEVRYSTSPAKNSDGSPSGTDTVTITAINATSYSVTGLSYNTVYYFWIRTVQGTNNSSWIGPQQTNTDPNVPTAAQISFAVTAGSLSNSISWQQPAGRSIKFSLYRTDPDGDQTRLLSKVTSTSHTDSKLVSPNTQYTYTLNLYDETDSLLSLAPASTITTTQLTNTITASVVNGVKIQANITFPIKAGLADIQTATNSAFTAGVTNHSVTRNDRTAIQTLAFTLSPVFNVSSTYYVRARLRYNDYNGPWSAGVSVTTGSVPQASRPTLTMTSPATGQVRIKVRFQDSTSYGDIAAVSYRLQSSVGEYTPYQSYSRDNPPSDDLDTREDRIEVIRSGFSPGTQYTFRLVIVRPQALESESRTDNVTVDS